MGVDLFRLISGAGNTWLFKETKKKEKKAAALTLQPPHAVFETEKKQGFQLSLPIAD